MEVQAGRLAPAEEAARRAHDAATATGDERDTMVADNELGTSARAGRPAGAERAYQAAMTVAARWLLGPRQRGVAARPVRELEQARRRAAGPGRPARGAAAYEQTHEIRSGWRPPTRATRAAARPVGERESSATCAGAGRPARGARRLRGEPCHRRPAGGSDPGNAEWQRDLSVSLERVASVRERQGDRAGAQVVWREALAVSQPWPSGSRPRRDRTTPAIHWLAQRARSTPPSQARRARRGGSKTGRSACCGR
jgi:hypothetical protein